MHFSQGITLDTHAAYTGHSTAISIEMDGSEKVASSDRKATVEIVSTSHRNDRIVLSLRNDEATCGVLRQVLAAMGTKVLPTGDCPEHKDGYFCTLPSGHGGWHVAGGTRTIAVHCWPTPLSADYDATPPSPTSPVCDHCGKPVEVRCIRGFTRWVHAGKNVSITPDRCERVTGPFTVAMVNGTDVPPVDLVPSTTD